MPGDIGEWHHRIGWARSAFVRLARLTTDAVSDALLVWLLVAAALVVRRPVAPASRLRKSAARGLDLPAPSSRRHAFFQSVHHLPHGRFTRMTDRGCPGCQNMAQMANGKIPSIDERQSLAPGSESDERCITSLHASTSSLLM